MRKLVLCFLFGIVFLCCAIPARAQVTVSATVKDANSTPCSGGTVVATLVPAGVPATVNGQQIAGQVGPATLDVNGTFSMNVFANNVISPSGTRWTFTVNCDSHLPPPVGTGGQQTIAASQNITGTTSLSSTLSTGLALLTNINASAGSVPFGSIQSGTNTTAAMVVGTGASLAASGTGTITATSVPFSGVTSATDVATLVLNGVSDATTPLSIAGHSATQTAPVLSVSNNSSSLPADHGAIVFRGDGQGTFPSGTGSPSIVQIDQNDTTPWGMVFTNKVAPAGFFTGAFMETTGAFQLDTDDATATSSAGLLFQPTNVAGGINFPSLSIGTDDGAFSGNQFGLFVGVDGAGNDTADGAVQIIANPASASKFTQFDGTTQGASIGLTTAGEIDLTPKAGQIVKHTTPIQFNGTTSGSAQIGVAAVAGTPNELLLPTTTGTSGQVLSTNGGSPQQLSWTTVSASPGGSNTQVQFNDGGAFNGATGITYVKATQATTLTSTGNNVALTVNGSGTADTLDVVAPVAGSPMFQVDHSGNVSMTLGTAAHVLIKSGSDFTMINGGTTLFQVNASGAAAQYDSVATAGIGLPGIFGYNSQTAQTTAISAKTLFTVGAANTLFHFHAGLSCNSASAAATVLVSLIYTSTNGSSTRITLPSGVATCTTLGSASESSFDVSFMAKTATTIQYSTTIVNTPTYDVRVAVTQLGAN
jgi:hypothetical protein